MAKPTPRELLTALDTWELVIDRLRTADGELATLRAERDFRYASDSIESQLDIPMSVAFRAGHYIVSAKLPEAAKRAKTDGRFKDAPATVNFLPSLGRLTKPEKEKFETAWRIVCKLRRMAMDAIRSSAKSASEAKQAKGKKWQDVAQLAGKYCQRNAYPGVTTLAKILGCSKSTVSKAVAKTPGLRHLKDTHAASKPKSPRPLTSAALATTPQTSETDPLENVVNDEQLANLLAISTPEEQAAILAMPRERQLELVRVASYDPDPPRHAKRKS